MKVTYEFDSSDEEQREERFLFENAPRWFKAFETARVEMQNALRAYNKEWHSAEETIDEIRDIFSELPDTEVFHD